MPHGALYFLTVQVDAIKLVSRAFRRPVVVLAVLVFWLGLNVASALPELHRRIHHDSHGGQHECLLTQFAKGQFTGPEALPCAVIVPRHPARPAPPPVFVACGSFDFRTTSPRAPPASSHLLGL